MYQRPGVVKQIECGHFTPTHTVVHRSICRCNVVLSVLGAAPFSWLWNILGRSRVTLATKLQRRGTQLWLQSSQNLPDTCPMLIMPWIWFSITIAQSEPASVSYTRATASPAPTVPCCVVTLFLAAFLQPNYKTICLKVLHSGLTRTMAGNISRKRIEDIWKSLSNIHAPVVTSRLSS